jgi:antagonist of KipI
MGYRLDGEPIAGPDGLSLLSLGLPIGAVQILPSGGVIVAMADRQTAGGYPRVATVVTADIPVLGQLAPGDWIEFERCDHRTAREALTESERWRECT